MKKSIAVLISLLLAGCALAGTSKEVTRYIATNSWDQCITWHNRGLVDSIADTYGCGIIVGPLYYTISSNSFLRIDCNTPCQKEHLADYPKSNAVVNGVQWVHLYADVVTIGDSIQTNMYKQYDYPHEKQQVVTTTVLKRITSTVTNKTQTVNPDVCRVCGKKLTLGCPCCRK